MSDVIVRWMQNLQQEVLTGHHRFIVDEPQAAGGEDAGPDPYSLLLGALGSCTAMTLLLYAKRKNWQLEQLEVILRHETLHAEDCLLCESEKGSVSHITRHLRIQGQLTDEQLERLRLVAAQCPVHKTLTSEIVIEDTIEHVMGAPT